MAYVSRFAAAFLAAAACAGAWYLEESEPSFLPDGESIIFVSNKTGIGIVNADGTGKKGLNWKCLESQGRVFELTLSPNGNEIALVCHNTRDYNDGSDLYLVDADGDNLRRLTFFGDCPESYFTGMGKPRFSSDGKKLVFTRQNPDGYENWIYTVNVDGTGLTRISDEKAFDYSPVFIPGSGNIVYSYIDDYYPELTGNQSDIYIYDINERTNKRISDSKTCYFDPAVSPDGTRVIYVGGERDEETHQEEFNLYVTDLESRETRGLLAEPAYVKNPQFLPGGNKVAYGYFPSDSPMGFYIRDLEENTEVHLPEVFASDYAFSPNGDKIAFVDVVGDLTRVLGIINADGSAYVVTDTQY